MFHAAHAAVGPLEYRPPGCRLRQDVEQALVKKIIGAVCLTAERRTVTPGGGQDDAVWLGHLPGCEAAAVTGRDDDDCRDRGAAARQGTGKLVRGERPVRPGEPQTAAALTVRG